jgi:group I intron endonuclease
MEGIHISGEIYKITNIANGMCYVGQVVSHRKNRGVYKPFGSICRFKDHISEAINNTKKKQCWYLNNAIRKYGVESFAVEVLCICKKEDMNRLEQQYIKEFNTLYPNGYNLTIGGKTGPIENAIERTATNTPKKRGGCVFRTSETRRLISEKLKSSDKVIGVHRMKQVQAQHLTRKLKKFETIKLNPLQLETYIYPLKNKVDIRVDGRRITTFVGKYESIDVLKERAMEFLRHVSATLSNCSGTP